MNGAGLDPLALPVQIVELHLHKLHVGIFGQDLIQQLGRVVEGKAGVLHKAFGLLLEKPVEAVVFLVLQIVGGLDAVDEIIVKIACAGLLELFVEDPVAVLEGMEEAAVQLGGQRKAVPGIAVHNGFLRGALAGKAVIHDSRIEIGKAPFDKDIDHFLELIHID